MTDFSQLGYIGTGDELPIVGHHVCSGDRINHSVYEFDGHSCLLNATDPSFAVLDTFGNVMDELVHDSLTAVVLDQCPDTVNGLLVRGRYFPKTLRMLFAIPFLEVISDTSEPMGDKSSD